MPSLSRTDSENARTVFFSHIYETMAPEHSVTPQFTVNTRPRERRGNSACHYRRSGKGRTRRQAQAAVWPAERKKCSDLEVFRAVICKNISSLQRWQDQKDFFFFSIEVYGQSSQTIMTAFFFIYNVWNGIQWQWQFECFAVIPNHGFRFCNLVF